MKAICFNFEIHQPFRLKRYRFFDIGKDHYYYDDFLNDDIMEPYRPQLLHPAAETLLRMIEQSEGRFRCSIAMSGVAFEQFEQYVPEFIDLLQPPRRHRMPWNSWHSHMHIPWPSLNDPEEFAAQMGDTCSLLRNRFGVTTKSHATPSLSTDDDLAPQLVELGFKGVLTEGAKHILGWKSPNYVYTAASAPSLKMLLRNGKLSDDIAFRFTDTSWPEFPSPPTNTSTGLPPHPPRNRLSTSSSTWKHSATCSRHQRHIPVPRSPSTLRRRTGHRIPDTLRSHRKIKPVGELSVMHPISPAPTKHATSRHGSATASRTKPSKNSTPWPNASASATTARLKQDWLRLQTCDHFFYMSTKRKADGMPTNVQPIRNSVRGIHQLHERAGRLPHARAGGISPHR